MSWILQQPSVVEKLGWLRKALLPHSGLNLLMLLDVDLTGVHESGRVGNHADFDSKINVAQGFLRVFPLLVVNKDDACLN